MKYKAKNDLITDADAQAIGEELERLHAEGLSRTPRNLLERARNRKSPLHHLFQWDDEKAAELQRIQTARSLIASVDIVHVREGPSKGYHSIRYHVDDRPRREYATRKEVLSDDLLLQQVSDRLFSAISAATREATSLGLGSKSTAWASLLRLVPNEPPQIG